MIEHEWHAVQSLHWPADGERAPVMRPSTKPRPPIETFYPKTVDPS